jgi:hypothetical protein
MWHRQEPCNVSARGAYLTAGPPHGVGHARPATLDILSSRIDSATVLGVDELHRNLGGTKGKK